MESRVEVSDLNKDSSIESLDKYLKSLDVDKVHRKELTPYEQGENVGFLKCMDFINGIVNKG